MRLAGLLGSHPDLVKQKPEGDDEEIRLDGEYYFTDGHNVWTVRFLRPDGFRYWRNLLFAAHGTDIFSYEINLIIVSKEI